MQGYYKDNYLRNPKGIMSWIFTLDHKRIGLMYLFAIIFFFGVAGLVAVGMRTELMTAESQNNKWDEGESYIDADTNGRWDDAESFTDAVTVNGKYDEWDDFVDENGNGKWDSGESFTDTKNGQYDKGEEFVDKNKNGKWDDAEDFTDSNNNGVWDEGEAWDPICPIGDDPMTYGKTALDLYVQNYNEAPNVNPGLDGQLQSLLDEKQWTIFEDVDTLISFDFNSWAEAGLFSDLDDCTRVYMPFSEGASEHIYLAHNMTC